MRIASALIAAGLLLTTTAHATSNDLLPIERGTYVRDGADATDPPFVAMLAYDGSSFSGPHSSACTSTLLEHRDANYRVSTTCLADGDGTPAAPHTEQADIVVQSTTRLRFSHGDDTAIYRCVKGS